ncbi:MAG TPA: hypothetical protein DCZ68_07235 [Faecalibacterium sp.]|nr:hypothetical protein [Faecalibacterium sp.]
MECGVVTFQIGRCQKQFPSCKNHPILNGVGVVIQIFWQFVFFAFIGFPLSSQVFDDTKLRPRYRQWTRWDECALFWQKMQDNILFLFKI